MCPVSKFWFGTPAWSLDLRHRGDRQIKKLEMMIGKENQPSKIHTSQLVQIQPEARGHYLRTLRAREDPTCKFTSLADLLTADFLEECLWELKSDKAPGH
jgi:hypothetical protein